MSTEQTALLTDSKDNPQELSLVVQNSHNVQTTFRVPNTSFARWWIEAHLPVIQFGSEKAKTWWHAFPFMTWVEPQGLALPPISKYQIMAILRLSVGNAALWLDMGLGKTYITIARCLQMYEKKQNVFVVVCPPAIFGTWEHEISKFILPSMCPQVVLAHGQHRKKKLAAIREQRQTLAGPTFVITSYETVATILPELKLIKPAAFIFDECSKIKNLDAQRTIAAHALVRGTESYVYLLSGTPSTKSIEGYYSLYEMLGKCCSGYATYNAYKDSLLLGIEFSKLKLPNGTHSICRTDALKYLKDKNSGKTYLSEGYYFTKIKSDENKKAISVVGAYKKYVPNPEKVHILKKKTNQNAYVLRKADVAKDLPDKIFIRREVEMGPEQHKLYRQVLEQHRGELKGKPFSFANYNFSAAGKLHQIANGYVIIDGVPHALKEQPKLAELDLVLAEIGDEKLVVWSPFRFQLSQICHHLKKLPFVEIHGGTPINKRSGLLEEFRREDGAQILVANPDVAGLGLNLEFSNIQVFFTNWFKPDVRKQAVDRQHRITQKNVVTVIDLVTKDTLEEHILSTIKKEICLEGQILGL